MVEVVRVYRESMPNVRLVGKRYTDEDRDPNGSFTHKWCEWFEEGYFQSLEDLPQLPNEMNGYLGFMRVAEQFEYWIGVFTTDRSAVPAGFDYLDIDANEIATCWILGREDNGELFGCETHQMCVDLVQAQGWLIDHQSGFFERYNCPRFTTPDGTGKVILDYCIYLAN